MAGQKPDTNAFPQEATPVLAYHRPHTSLGYETGGHSATDDQVPVPVVMFKQDSSEDVAWLCESSRERALANT